MTRKNFAMIPVLAAVALIPQLLFWWLAPAAAAWLVIYIGGTVLTVGIPAAYLVTYWRSNLRRSAGLLVVCCILETAVAGLSTLLLGLDVSIRSAVFAFIITALVCLIVMVPTISAAVKPQVQGVYPADIPEHMDNLPVRDVQAHGNGTASPQVQHPMPPRKQGRQTASAAPLPPRNR